MFLETFKFVANIEFVSGSHPFDHDIQTSSNWVADTSGSHLFGLDLQTSLNWIADTSGSPTPHYKKTNQADMKVKDRIVHGSVEYFENPWSQLADGLSLYCCPDSLTCLSLPTITTSSQIARQFVISL